MSAPIFESIKAALAADSSLGKKVGGVLAFVLSNPKSEWTVDCKSSTVQQGAGKADCTITISEADFVALATGKLNGMSAFMSGKMKIKGNMGLAQKFAALTEAAKKAGAAPAAPVAAAASTAAGPAGFKSTAVFEKIAANLKADPGLVKKVNGVFHFNVTGGPGGASAQWTVDAKGGDGVKPTAPAKADCTITIGDTDMVAMATGKLSGMSAFMSGKMKIKGNMGLAQKFGVLAGDGKSKL